MHPFLRAAEDVKININNLAEFIKKYNKDKENINLLNITNSEDYINHIRYINYPTFYCPRLREISLPILIQLNYVLYEISQKKIYLKPKTIKDKFSVFLTLESNLHELLNKIIPNEKFICNNIISTYLLIGRIITKFSMSTPIYILLNRKKIENIIAIFCKMIMMLEKIAASHFEVSTIIIGCRIFDQIDEIVALKIKFDDLKEIDLNDNEQNAWHRLSIDRPEIIMPSIEDMKQVQNVLSIAQTLPVAALEQLKKCIAMI